MCDCTKQEEALKKDETVDGGKVHVGFLGQDLFENEQQLQREREREFERKKEEEQKAKIKVSR